MAGQAPKRKAVLLICDGLGDRPVGDLGGRTPLEAANTPTLDRLCRGGMSGMMYSIRPGIVAGSDTAHLAILGFDPYEHYTGRGPYECAGIDMDVRKGDVAFRVNFSTLYEGDPRFADPTVDPVTGALNATVRDRRAGRIEEGTDQLAAALNGLDIDGVTCLFKESVAHRAGLILRGPGLGHLVSDVDPHAVDLPVLVAKGEDDASRTTAAVLNRFVARSWELLRSHPVNLARVADGCLPANVALPRGVGTAPAISGFDAAYHVTSACIVETGLIRGIGVYLGMDIIDVPGATGGLDSDLDAMARAIADALDDHTFVLCNMKGPDIAGHDGNAEAKKAIVERIDGAVGVLLGSMPPDTIIAVTADHGTPVETLDHSGDAVPFLVNGPGVLTTGSASFSERACASGGLGVFRGTDVMPMLTNLMNVQPKYGA
jgi:2,3-bisphosphoglycerate-independent phosphoglycerate mutase